MRNWGFAGKRNKENGMVNTRQEGKEENGFDHRRQKGNQDKQQIQEKT